MTLYRKQVSEDIQAELVRKLETSSLQRLWLDGVGYAVESIQFIGGLDGEDEWIIFLAGSQDAVEVIAHKPMKTVWAMRMAPSATPSLEATFMGLGKMLVSAPFEEIRFA